MSERSRNFTEGTGIIGERMAKVYRLVSSRRAKGMTVKELRERDETLHHGSASAALSDLHKQGHLSRLEEKRESCAVYVLPLYVEGRSTETPGRNKVTKAKHSPFLALSVLAEHSRTHWKHGKWNCASNCGFVSESAEDFAGHQVAELEKAGVL